LLFLLRIFLVFPTFQFHNHKERSRDLSLLNFTCICQVSIFPNLDTIFHFLYWILHEPLESWNAIGKHWLRKLDIKFNEKYFVCKCSNVSTLNLNILPIFYKICIQSWSKLQELIQLCHNDIDSILKTRIYCNSSISFKNKPLVLSWY
jgi:hypothetical protein